MSALAPDVPQAAEFLEALAGDPMWSKVSAPHTFQTFDDNNDRKAQNLLRIHHGTIADLSDDLVSLNQAGAGVFVMVNAGDGRGRRAENTTEVRALFIDDDDNKVKAHSLHLPPSISVKSGRGWHFYWLVYNCALSEFPTAQKRLAAHYGTDSVIHDLPRVMRLPGFYHQKVKGGQSRGPVMVTLEELRTDRVYSLANLTSALPPPPIQDMPKWIPRATGEPGDAKSRCRRYLSHVPPAIEGAGGDEATYRVACIVAVDFGLGDSDALDCMMEWNQRCSPPWGHEELEAKIKHARRYAKKVIGNKLETRSQKGIINNSERVIY